jgi:hypothetical protein
MQFHHMVRSKLAVIGDIHSNALALRASLRSIVEYESNFSAIDTIVFVGDLLSYGVHPEETLNLLNELASSRPSVMVLGNHDQMYIELLANSFSGYYNKLPDWIRESVHFNLARIDAELFLGINFVPQYFCNDVIISHANFSALGSGPADWSYVNSLEDHLEQLLVLAQRSFRLGVLGHTHRNCCFSLVPAGVGDESTHCVRRAIQFDTQMNLSGYSCSIVNAGSIGQPREKSCLDPAWLLIEFQDFSAKIVTFVSFDYDVAAHLKHISESELSSSCIRRLTSYFAKAR